MKLLVLMIVIVIMHASIICIASDRDLKYNGTDWMSFRSGIIKSCRLVIVNLAKDDYSNNTLELRFSDNLGLDIIKKWLLVKFDNKLSMSPVSPKYESIMWGNQIALFSSENGEEDSLLLVIPLNSLTLGSEKEQQAAIKELKEMGRNWKRGGDP